MKVYKKDVNNFLLKVEEKAIKSVQKKYDDMILQSKTERVDDYLKEMREFGRKLEALVTEAQELYGKHQHLYDKPAWSNLCYVVSYLQNALSNCNGINASSVMANAHEQQLFIEKKEQLNEVQKEYAKLKHYAKNNSAKESYNLLKEIGFNVSSLEQKEESLITMADKSKLFVCGENK